jgi:hypothetical protein
MRIHITTTAPEQAALQILNHMQNHGGEWIVNAVAGEGYILASGVHAKQLLRSGAVALSGVIHPSLSLDALSETLAGIRKVSKDEVGEADDEDMQKDKPEHDDGWVPPTRAALELLETRHVTIAELRSALGVSRNGAHSVMRRLVESNRAVIVERLPAVNGSSVCVYGKAA